jgi:hypothetical protein
MALINVLKKERREMGIAYGESSSVACYVVLSCLVICSANRMLSVMCRNVAHFTHK